MHNHWVIETRQLTENLMGIDYVILLSLLLILIIDDTCIDLRLNESIMAVV